MWLFTELKRRNVFRVSAAYAVASWLLIQVAETIFPLFGFSESPARVVVVVLAIGFPVVLALSWLYELTPDGLRLESDVDRSRSITGNTGKKLDRAIIVVLTMALGYFAFDKFILDPARDVTLEENVKDQVRSNMLIESYGNNSIAVLPFVNMSDDANNEYFSDGVSEEILNLLSMVSQLRVISRSSAFSYKDKEIAIPAIAEELNVNHVLEGSVRKVGNTVRITAQLIEARTDTHLWSETFDRKLDDVFAIQDEIAAIVVEKLKVSLTRNAPQTQTTDPEAYVLYLQARHVSRQQDADSLKQAEQLYKKSLAIDPTYAKSWYGLGSVYSNYVNTNLLPTSEAFRLAQETTEKILELDPNSAIAYEGLGWLANKRDNDLSMAAYYIQRALELDPGNIEVLASAATLLQDLGRLQESIVATEYVVSRDPVNPVAYNNLGARYLYDHRLPQARTSLSKILVLSPNYIGARYFLGLVELLMGKPESALENFEQEQDDEWRLKGRALAFYALGLDEEANSALTQLITDWGDEWPSEIAQVYSYRHDLDNAFRWLAKEQEEEGGWGEGRLNPLYENLYTDPRWQELLEKMGVSDRQLAEIDFEVDVPDQ